jgi:hypothetical protein
MQIPCPEPSSGGLGGLPVLAVSLAVLLFAGCNHSEDAPRSGQAGVGASSRRNAADATLGVGESQPVPEQSLPGARFPTVMDALLLKEELSHFERSLGLTMISAHPVQVFSSPPLSIPDLEPAMAATKRNLATVKREGEFWEAARETTQGLEEVKKALRAFIASPGLDTWQVALGRSQSLITAAEGLLEAKSWLASVPPTATKELAEALVSLRQRLNALAEPTRALGESGATAPLAAAAAARPLPNLDAALASIHLRCVQAIAALNAQTNLDDDEFFHSTNFTAYKSSLADYSGLWRDWRQHFDFANASGAVPACDVILPLVRIALTESLDVSGAVGTFPLRGAEVFEPFRQRCAQALVELAALENAAKTNDRLRTLPFRPLALRRPPTRPSTQPPEFGESFQAYFALDQKWTGRHQAFRGDALQRTRDPMDLRMVYKMFCDLVSQDLDWREQLGRAVDWATPFSSSDYFRMLVGVSCATDAAVFIGYQSAQREALAMSMTCMQAENDFRAAGIRWLTE